MSFNQWNDYGDTPMRRTRNDHEVKTYIDGQTYLLALKLAAKRDRSLSDFLRQAIRFYVGGCSHELNPPVAEGSREEIGDG